MKKINTWYWIVTILFSGFMIFSAVPNIMVNSDSIALFTGLGYPKYFIPFIGVAKLIGSIVLLIPGLKYIKEWAYAGLFFDLFGAIYSAIAAFGLQTPMLFMVLPFSFLFISYYLWHKKRRHDSYTAPAPSLGFATE